MVICNDKMHVSQSRNIHVLLVFIALLLELMRADGGLFRYLAFLPSFRSRDAGVPKKSEQEQYDPVASWPLQCREPYNSTLSAYLAWQILARGARRSK